MICYLYVLQNDHSKFSNIHHHTLLQVFLFVLKTFVSTLLAT